MPNLSSIYYYWPQSKSVHLDEFWTPTALAQAQESQNTVKCKINMWLETPKIF